MPTDLFAAAGAPLRDRIDLAPDAVLLPARALELADRLLADITAIAARVPFRHMKTPGGRAMSVAMTSCGQAGWVSDARGYRYATQDPASGAPWAPMPAHWRDLARDAAQEAGFRGFDPDMCLINRYAPGARMGLHQDRDEADLADPIVSVSLGLPARFQFGGLARSDTVRRVGLAHGDVVVWGGRMRLAYHGVLPLAAGVHPQAGEFRFNLTFRRAMAAAP